MKESEELQEQHSAKETQVNTLRVNSWEFRREQKALTYYEHSDIEALDTIVMRYIQFKPGDSWNHHYHLAIGFFPKENMKTKITLKTWNTRECILYSSKTLQIMNVEKTIPRDRLPTFTETLRARSHSAQFLFPGEYLPQTLLKIGVLLTSITRSARHVAKSFEYYISWRRIAVEILNPRHSIDTQSTSSPYFQYNPSHSFVKENLDCSISSGNSALHTLWKIEALMTSITRSARHLAKSLEYYFLRGKIIVKLHHPSTKPLILSNPTKTRSRSSPLLLIPSIFKNKLHCSLFWEIFTSNPFEDGSAVTTFFVRHDDCDIFRFLTAAVILWIKLHDIDSIQF